MCRIMPETLIWWRNYGWARLFAGYLGFGNLLWNNLSTSTYLRFLACPKVRVKLSTTSLIYLSKLAHTHLASVLSQGWEVLHCLAFENSPQCLSSVQQFDF